MNVDKNPAARDMTLRERAAWLARTAEELAAGLDMTEYAIHEKLFGPYPAEARKEDAMTVSSLADELRRLEMALAHIAGIRDRLSHIGLKIELPEAGAVAEPSYPPRAYEATRDETAPARQTYRR